MLSRAIQVRAVPPTPGGVARLICVGAVVAAVAACELPGAGKRSDVGPDGAPTGPASATVAIGGADYGTPTVPAGSVITVVNNDLVSHTLTGDGFSSGELAPGASSTVAAPRGPGEYRIFCDVHPQMAGVLRVV
ncbi:hypothetical protein Sya03_59990 [Spirilliplanes yamanashiensis]|uniref:EfeO-type cupredoxin-like domain-containing protein n=1 Tax=Spirilliplanes yamanashiensis TaxID=42233 RepID=A0A8J3YFB8_9ACTN|nr:hypothetical protein Sya03_59990 [Spirilliplanes yamanashiensis]